MQSRSAFDIRLPSRRQVESELLDQLPAEDPRAVGSRRDLRRINTLMMQPRIVARALARHCTTVPRTILDLGSGDGTLMLKVAQRLSPLWSNVKVTLLDQQNMVSHDTRSGFAALQWRAESVVSDVFTFLEQPAEGIDVVITNLFLHHFEGSRLRRLLELAAQRAPLFVACEPRRGNIALLLSAMTWAIGANEVTRHDAVASVHAGFSGHELSALWPQRGVWHLHEWSATPLSHCFVAVRDSAGERP